MIFLFLLFFLSYPTSSSAYFDPGTGAFILQSILAFFGVIIFYLGYPIKILKNFYSKLKVAIKKKKIN